MRSVSGAAGLVLAVWVGLAAGQPDKEDDLKDVPSQDLKAGGDADQRYCLVGPKKGAEAPKRGYGVVVVLPGGGGGADFHPFVKRIYQQAVPAGLLVAQPVAVKWTDDQEVVWPTETNRVAKMK